MLPLVLFATMLKISFAFDLDLVSSEYFIDKTNLLKEFFRRNQDVKIQNHYIACPPGFGKTTNLKMIKKFSEIEFDEKGNAKHWRDTEAYRLFEKLKISHQESSIANDHMGRHPVLFFELNFDFCRLTKQEEILTTLNSRLLDSFKKYMPQLLDHIKTTGPNTTFERLLDEVNELKMSKEVMPIFLHDLCQILYNCSNQTAVIILVDEFDYVINQGSPSIDILHQVYHLFYKMFSPMFKTSNQQTVYGMMAGTTSLAFRYYRFVEFSQIHYFSETSFFTPFFGFLENELDYLFDKYDCDQTEKHYVTEYYAGYKTVDQHVLRYNSYSISEYFKQRNGMALQFPIIQYGGAFRQTLIPNFLKDAPYLDKVAKLLKNCPIVGLFKHRYDHKAVKSFELFIKHDFGNLELPFRGILYTYTIEQGFFAPVTENIYVIPNYDIRSRFITYLRYNYEQRLRIDLKTISQYIREILQSPIDQPQNLSLGLTEVLNSAFNKFRPFRESGSTLEFTHQLIIHVSALSYWGLRVIEDYPQIGSLNETRFNPQKRCVTVVTFGDSAAVIKITYNLPLETALLRATSYSYQDQSINRVKYIAVDIPYRNFTRIFMATLNVTDRDDKIR